MRPANYKGLLQNLPVYYYGNMNPRWILCLFIFLPLWAGYARGKSEKKTQLPKNDVLPALIAQDISSSSEPEQTPGQTAGWLAQFSAEEIFHAFVQAYPDRIREPEFRDGDWTIEVYGERFYYAEGRLLPASLRDRVNEYNPQPLYSYPKELPPWVPPTPEESARMAEREALRLQGQDTPKRSSAFYDAIWRAHDRDEAYDHIKQIRFMANPFLLHYSILSQLSLVEEYILKAAKTNAAVKQWVDNLETVGGWNWRSIADSGNRSFHSYGAAIDLLPKSLEGLETYWLWASDHTPEWWAVPYTKRFHPPDEVINIFESFGFIWGGKWRYYDTMHFEYRPEILILNGIALTDLRDLR